MDGMLSHPDLCTPTLSSILPGLTWHRVGGVRVDTFEDQYIKAPVLIIKTVHRGLREGHPGLKLNRPQAWKNTLLHRHVQHTMQQNVVTIAMSL